MTKLEGTVEYTEEDGLDSIQDYYDECNNGAQNNSIADEYRAELSAHATKASRIIDALSQQVFKGNTAGFQQNVQDMKAAVGELQQDLIKLANAEQIAKNIAQFAKFLDDGLTIAAGIAKSFRP